MALKRRTDHWPAPPLVLPRGAREWIWHAGVALALVVLLVKPLGVVLLPLTTSVAVVLNITPRRLVRMTGQVAAVALLAAFVTGATRHPGALAALILLSRLEPGVSRLADDLVFVLATYAQAWGTTALLLTFDRRIPNPDVVDARVFERQGRRRRQLLTRWHASATIDEVVA